MISIGINALLSFSFSSFDFFLLFEENISNIHIFCHSHFYFYRIFLAFTLSIYLFTRDKKI